MSDILDRFFHARSLAIIGASTDPDKLGGRPLRQCLDLGFKGRLYPVNPGAKEVQGVPALAAIADLPSDVDCALIALPASGVEAAVDACARKKVPLAIILSSGFAEHSAAGREAQTRIAARARQAGMRLVGPNSMGGISFETAISATFTSVADHEGRGWPPLGGVGIASQSGFVGSHLLGMFRDRGLGVSKWIATGNQADIDLADCIEHYARDAITRVIVVYLEGVARPDALRAAFDLARARGKPVVALRAGRTDLGARAVASHTASLVGSQEAYEAVFRRHGVFSASSVDELIDVVVALDTGRAPIGPRLGVATVSGGFGILISDAAARHEFELPQLDNAAQARIRAVNPLATTGNPVDMGTLARFQDAIQELLDGPYDSILMAAGHFGLIVDRMEKLSLEMAEFRTRYPNVFIGFVANLDEKWRVAFQRMGVFVCEDPDRAVRAMAAARDMARDRRQPLTETLPEIPRFDVATIAGDERGARGAIRAIDIDVVADELATSADAAVAAARAFATPVALKIVSPDIPHKSDIGGVALGLAGDESVAAAYRGIMDRARAAHPGARIEGVMVSPMISGGVETIMGVKRDDVFGPVVMFGLGGVFVEVFRDTAVNVAPFGLEVAREMIRSIRAYPLLAGARGRPPVDIEALASALSRLSIFAHRNADRIETIDINPIVALPTGAIALDAWIAPR